MSIITYPLNGISYTAEDAESYLCTRTSGVFSSDGHFAISITGARQVTISPGLAWIKNGEYTGKSIINTAPVVLSVPVADGALDRMDRIVLRFSKMRNTSEIMLLSGAPASSPSAPAISRTELEYDLALYDIRVPRSSINVSISDITSNLLNEELCGIMRDSVTGIPTAHLHEQAQALMNELRENVTALMGELRTEADAVIAALQADLDGVKDTTSLLLRSGGEMTGDLRVGSSASTNLVQLLIQRFGYDSVARALINYISSNGEAVMELTKNGAQVNAVSIAENETRFAKPIAFNGGASGDAARRARENMGLFIANEVTGEAGRVVTNNAVAEYAAPLAMFVLTDRDPGVGTASPYPDGTRIDVYE